MTYVIAAPCIDVRDQSCIEVCPVDCIHVFERMLVIDPGECIDCGACEPECPVNAVFPEATLPPQWAAFSEVTAAYDSGADVVNKLVNAYAHARPAEDASE